MLQPNLIEWFALTKVRGTLIKYEICFRVSDVEGLFINGPYFGKFQLKTTYLDAADDINRIASSIYTLGTQDSTDLCKYAYIAVVSLKEWARCGSVSEGCFFLFQIFS